MAQPSKPIIGKWTNRVLTGMLAAANSQTSSSETFSSSIGYPRSISKKKESNSTDSMTISTETDPIKLAAIVKSIIATREFTEKLQETEQFRTSAIEQQKSWVQFVIRERERSQSLGLEPQRHMIPA